VMSVTTIAAAEALLVDRRRRVYAYKSRR